MKVTKGRASVLSFWWGWLLQSSRLTSSEERAQWDVGVWREADGSPWHSATEEHSSVCCSIAGGTSPAGIVLSMLPDEQTHCWTPWLEGLKVCALLPSHFLQYTITVYAQQCLTQDSSNAVRSTCDCFASEHVIFLNCFSRDKDQ